ncbi:MAG: TetR/AcrR family transcriptional regulator [Candidatus Geothermincolia bacterium]
MEKSAGKRASIIDEATRLFAEKGLEGTTIREISSGSGAGLGLITYYFKDKNDILNSVMMEKVVSQMGPVLAAENNPSGSGEQRLKRLFGAYCDFADVNHLGAMLMLRGLLRLIEGGANPIVEVVADRLRAIEKILVDGQEAGEFKKVEPVYFSQLFISMVFDQPLNNLAYERYPHVFGKRMNSHDNQKLFDTIILEGLLLDRKE